MGQHAAARDDDDDQPVGAGRLKVARRERRPIVSAADVEEMFERQRTPASALPDPVPLVLNLARCVVEITAGVRDPEQLSRWLEPGVYAQLLKRAIIAARARHARGSQATMPTISMGSCRVDQTAEDAVEAVAIVHTPTRVRAVAMRLAGIDGRWRAEELSIL